MCVTNSGYAPAPNSWRSMPCRSPQWRHGMGRAGSGHQRRESSASLRHPSRIGPAIRHPKPNARIMDRSSLPATLSKRNWRRAASGRIRGGRLRPYGSSASSRLSSSCNAWMSLSRPAAALGLDLDPASRVDSLRLPHQFTALSPRHTTPIPRPRRASQFPRGRLSA